MIEGGKGGAHTRTGLIFEEDRDIRRLFEKIPGYQINPSSNKTGYAVYFRENLLAYCFKKREFYNFLSLFPDYMNNFNKPSWMSEPDCAILNLEQKTLFIIEVKYQNVRGSVDEKLQTCDFKRQQYMKLVGHLGWRVEYVFLLNDWFKQPKYKDVLSYIEWVNCHYFFNEVPLSWLGFPTS